MRNQVVILSVSEESQVKVRDCFASLAMTEMQKLD